ncbi:Na(+)-translocating NADH-quinone reductase subunit C [Agaribacter marinus]|uniref:Na(+)-translocating NADH-quinone reductase subunit C n=1 Tax=Agaribacter marinus TaxID=1431249 RepID=A0AA37WLM0_9ALTE|nr:Na(+)-translocating NADH-quinone reductase subunit C [Agaribacter marinus]GLR72769.1 Na(+)-translocating NADH-quinone reductase subunit C [Agaribacter marinus]
MSAKKETLGKTIGVVVAVCLACSIVVSSAAVGLRSLQDTNAALDKKSNILTAAGLIELATNKSEIDDVYNTRVEEKFVDLSTGQYVDKPYDTYDMYKAAKNPDYAVSVEGSNVGFLRRSSVASVYHVKNEQGDVNRIILPVHGSGLWDIMYGFLALDNDGETIRELIYYQHKETPGLGGEIQNPDWQKKWDGKQLYKNGEVAISVDKSVKPGDQYAVDALSGATLTSNGVENTLQYWASENGYGNYLKRQSWKS